MAVSREFCPGLLFFFLLLNMKLSPYITELLREKSGNEIRLSRDCELLALDVESVTGEHIVVNTMKRLLGFITDERTPRTSTLDVVAHYLGYANWDDLRLMDENSSNSAFDDRDEYLACYLEKGQQMHISYPPNRTLTIENFGENQIRVIERENTKLQRSYPNHVLSAVPLPSYAEFCFLLKMARKLTFSCLKNEKK